eukprot:1151768-Pelagomonas_calceolata.AAC.5
MEIIIVSTCGVSAIIKKQRWSTDAKCKPVALSHQPASFWGSEPKLQGAMVIRPLVVQLDKKDGKQGCAASSIQPYRHKAHPVRYKQFWVLHKWPRYTNSTQHEVQEHTNYLPLVPCPSQGNKSRRARATSHFHALVLSSLSALPERRGGKATRAVKASPHQ